MKKLTVAISAVAASVLMAMSAQAAEIYKFIIKTVTSWICTGKLMLSTTSPLMMQMMVILLMPVLASKVKPKSTIN